MITTITDYTIQDITDSIRYLLDKSSHDEGVRQLAVQITQGSSDPIAAVFDWVKSNVKYTPDPVDIELFTSPVRMVADFNDNKPLAEDCDGMALLTVALYRSLGMDAKVVLLDTIGQGIDHAIAEVYSEKLGEYLMVDPASHYPVGWKENYRGRLDT